MKVKDSVVLITGANRGLGQALARVALACGASKVYAAARDPASITLAGVEAIRLDVTQPEQIAAAAEHCRDLTVLINNAGMSRGSPLLAEGGLNALQAELETNFYGPLRTSQAFAPVLAANGGGAIVNVLSVLSWINLPGGSTYCVSKSAAWGLTNGLRNELRGQRTQVVGVHIAFMDTDMVRHIPGLKVSPEDVAQQVCQALDNDSEEVLADALSRAVKQGLSAEPGIYLQPPG